MAPLHFAIYGMSLFRFHVFIVALASYCENGPMTVIEAGPKAGKSHYESQDPRNEVRNRGGLY
ncbi:hypothetical protein GON05_36630 [Paenibacillus sp. MAH-34]|uniref:Uncharacterized protein n=1 Tax=Paenibacillus anseongense TaxID=2682845 RepID=A0ABW9UNL3_9BACL|nr:hypothetical protein [Paenibacillus anseongense]